EEHPFEDRAEHMHDCVHLAIVDRHERAKQRICGGGSGTVSFFAGDKPGTLVKKDNFAQARVSAYATQTRMRKQAPAGVPPPLRPNTARGGDPDPGAGATRVWS